jgi:large subunit ribosomal protein L5
MPDLNQYNHKEIRKKLTQDLGLPNIMMAPSVSKIVINIGLGEALVNKKVIENMEKQISLICGQKPVATHAKHDISTFKLRKGDLIGLKVTLRGKRMYNFLEKLVKIVLPRIRDFRGVSNNGFDAQGNYTLGLKEQIVFPEIEYSQVDKVRGLEITFVVSAKSQEESKKLLTYLGMPFAK